jgi:GNAT superfamily N-acetyltransferase
MGYHTGCVCVAALDPFAASISAMEIRTLRAADRAWVKMLVCKHFGSPRVVSRGVLHDVLALPGLVVERDAIPLGLLLYHMHRDQCEVVVLIAVVRRAGVGRALLDAVQAIARTSSCRRLWLITTNNNQVGLAFYRAVGWRQVAVYRGAVQEARRLKPEIPEFDADGTPIADEIEFELVLKGA